MNTEKLNKLEQQMEALQAELEKARAECNADEWPKVGDEYGTFNLYGAAAWEFHNDSFDARAKAQHRIFRTEEKAQAAFDYTFSKRAAIRREVELCGGFNPKGRWVIYIDTRGHVMTGYMHCCYGGPSFDTEAQALACREEIGDDDLLYLLTGEE